MAGSWTMTPSTKGAPFPQYLMHFGTGAVESVCSEYCMQRVREKDLMPSLSSHHIVKFHLLSMPPEVDAGAIQSTLIWPETWD